MSARASCFAALALAVAMLGCGDDPLAKLEEFSEQMCKCSDTACADKVNDELLEWMSANANSKDPGEQDKTRATKLTNKMVECAKKASMSDAENK
ncbi:MAG: hypothetical protein KJO07_10110 [Deltaproteobacteria bacterium]|nr:hypothetical protein [Deltaproteobacteria bacterium]